MNGKRKILIKCLNGQSEDVAEFLSLGLENTTCSNEQIIRYSFLFESGLEIWKKKLPAESELTFTRENKSKEIILSVEIEGDKVNPFSSKIKDEDKYSEERIIDNLLAGIGSEMKYRYRRNVNRISLTVPKTNAEEKVFIKNFSAIMFLIAAQFLMQNIAGHIDAFMLSFLDSYSMSAVSLIASFSEFHTGIITGFIYAATIMIIPLWRSRKRNEMHEAESVLSATVFLISMVFWFFTFFFTEKVMCLLTDIPPLINRGKTYLKILSFCYPLNAYYCMNYGFMRIKGKSYSVLLLSVTGCIINIMCNGILIYGIGFIPAMGIEGAAVASVTSSAFQAVASNIVMRKNGFETVKILRYKIFGNKIFRETINSTGTIILKSPLHHFAAAIMAIAFGHMDPDVIAAQSFVVVISTFIMSVRNGVANGSEIVMMKEYSKKSNENFSKKCKILLRICSKISLIIMVVLFILVMIAKTLPTNLNENALRYVTAMGVIYSISICCAINSAAITNGILNIKKDSFFAFLIDLSVMWGILVPIAVLSVNIISIPSIILAIILSGSEFFFLPPLVLRYKTKIESDNTAPKQ